MDWFRAINNYCERLDASYWAEPLNAVSNASFLIAAWIAWRMIGDRSDVGARLLTVVLAAIGVGSYLFHTHAQIWALVLDVAPIQIFILIYVYLATVRFFALPRWAGALAVVLFVPYAALAGRAIEALAGPLNGSTGYAPVPILIAAYAAGLLKRAPDSARGLAIGAGILVVSLVFRTVDRGVCATLPVGTHFLWHVLNGVMLGWMIAVLLRHGASEAVARGSQDGQTPGAGA